MRGFRCLSLWIALGMGCAPSQAAAGDKPEAAPATATSDLFVFRLKGVPPEAVAKAKTHPSYQVQELPDGIVEVRWDPRVPQVWEDLQERHGGKHYGEYLRDMLVIPGRLGKTAYSHGGLGTNGWGGTAFSGVRHWLRASIIFSDSSMTGVMLVFGALGPTPEEIRHEMLRGFPGTRVSVEKCGDGFVVVSRTEGGVKVAWQVNDETFVIIGDVYDKEMVAAYVNRLGSIIPKDFKVDVDTWVRDEIRYRIRGVDKTVRRAGWDFVSIYNQWCRITPVFPVVHQTRGFPKESMSSQELHAELMWLRHWLWANKDNFKYDDEWRGFLLKGPDRYDPEHPPELPEEMRGLPPPDYKPPEKQDAPNP